MKTAIVDDLGSIVGQRWLDRQRTSSGTFRVAAPLSSTPLPIYEWVVANKKRFDWSATEFVLMDEQLEGTVPPFRYIEKSDSASYEGFAGSRLIRPLQDAGHKVPIIKPDLQTLGGFDVSIDLLILAIGPSGNYANVMPGTQHDTGWHVAALTDEFRQTHTTASSDSYAGATFRTHGMSLGPQQVINAREVVVIARGTGKRALVEHLLSLDSFDKQFPISIVHDQAVRDRVEIVIDSDVGIQ